MPHHCGPGSLLRLRERPAESSDWVEAHVMDIRAILTEQILASSKEVTVDSSYSWEDTKIGLNSGF